MPASLPYQVRSSGGRRTCCLFSVHLFSSLVLFNIKLWPLLALIDGRTLLKKSVKALHEILTAETLHHAVDLKLHHCLQIQVVCPLHRLFDESHCKGGIRSNSMRHIYSILH